MGLIIGLSNKSGGESPTPRLQSKDVAITENGSARVTPDAGFNGLSRVTFDVNVSGGGGGADPSKPVLFFDYDGTLLYSYTLAEARALTALPELPTNNPRLVAQEWNHTLEQVNAVIGALHVGATYVTVSGATEVDIEVNPVTGMDFQVRTQQTDFASVLTVDWGDGTSDNYTGTAVAIRSHTYMDHGKYTVKLSITDGATYQIVGTGLSTPGFGTQAIAKMVERCFFGQNVVTIGNYVFSNCDSFTSVTIPQGVTSTGSSVFSNCYSLTSVNIPQGVKSIGGSAFVNCYSLTSVNIPQGVTSIGNYAFSACFSLTSVNIPQSVTSTGSSVFPNCYSLTSVNIPQGLTSIGNYVFSTCHSLTSVNIPQSVTSIGSGAFLNCFACREYVFSRIIPPTLSDVNAFSGIVPLCRIYVPDESVEAYKTATNWITYANYIYPISQRP